MIGPLASSRAVLPARLWPAGYGREPRLLAAFIGAIALHAAVLALPLYVALLPGRLPIVPSWAHWDAVYYVRLATSGYAPYVHGSDHTGLAFLPLYPLLLAGVIHLGLPPYAGAIALSCLCALATLLLFAHLVAQEWGPRVAARAVALLAATPAALFLTLGYSEALFLLLAISHFLLLRKQRWVWAAAIAGLAAATRPTGVVLALPYLVEWLRLYRRAPRAGLRHLVPVGLMALPLVGVAAYDASLGASPLAYLQTEHSVWHHTMAWPWTTLGGQLHALATLGAAGASLLPANVLALASAVLSLPLLVVAARRLPPAYSVYALAVVVMAVCASTGDSFYGRNVAHPFILPLGSAHRYLLAAFPLAIAAALALRHRLFVLITPLLALLQLGLGFLFLVRFWAG